MTVETGYGVPTVAMHTDKFDRVVRSVAEVNGMPGLRQVSFPQPIMGKTHPELRAYVDGRDPITGRPVMQSVVEGLTRPLDEREAGPAELDRSTPRLVEPDTEDNLHQHFLDNHSCRASLPLAQLESAVLRGSGAATCSTTSTSRQAANSTS